MRTLLHLGLILLVLAACDPIAPPIGEGGSGGDNTLARFAITGDELYIIDKQSLRHFDISDPNNPVEGGRITVGFNVQAINADDNRLYMSTLTELNTFDLADPDNPQLVGTYDGVNACNPVVFQGDYMYVSRRLGNPCGWSQLSHLAVVDFKDAGNPVESISYEMESPYGLGTSPNTLFVCEGGNGLRVFLTEDPVDLVQTAHFRNLEAFQVVPNGDVLVITASDGIYQYDISNPFRLDHISTIELN